MYYIDDEKGKKEVVDKVNKAIDIPLLTESMEEKIFAAFFNVLGGAIKKVLNKDNKVGNLLTKSKKPLIIIGETALQLKDNLNDSYHLILVTNEHLTKRILYLLQ